MSIRETAAARPAAFLDRDGTIIDDVHYVADPERVRLRPGAAAAIARLNRAGVPVIVITNQSGIARGLVTQRDYERVQERMATLLAADGARIDASYMCPHHPDFGGACECRKPGTQLFQHAAAEHTLDLARSVYIGDRWRDVAPAIALGGEGILIVDDTTDSQELAQAKAVNMAIVGSLAEAVALVFARDG